MGFLPNPRSCGYGGSTLSWSKINLISSACLLIAKKHKQTALELCQGGHCFCNLLDVYT
jgi:hypothetical protein